jgi:hypothetical protein
LFPLLLVVEIQKQLGFEIEVIVGISKHNSTIAQADNNANFENMS